MPRKKTPAGREFLRRTRPAALEPSAQQRGEPSPPLAWEPPAGAEVLALPPPEQAGTAAAAFRSLVTERCSRRTFAEEPVTLAELSFLLWSCQGVQEVWPGAGTRRTVPSAGARHALETYLLLHAGAGLEPGLYHYAALQHALVPLEGPPDAAARVVAACHGQRFLGTAAAVFLWAAVPYRMTWRYGQRGYRYLFLDAGHACQNLYLAAEALGAGCCAVAAFDDQALDDLLGLDGQEAFAIYAAAVGHRTPAPPTRT
jgi:SagB-type dehydrogenase family enzyme